MVRRAVGTPEYAPPEALVTRREMDAAAASGRRRAIAAVDGEKVDVFGLGVVLFCCMTGNLPFDTVCDPLYAALQSGTHWVHSAEYRGAWLCVGLWWWPLHLVPHRRRGFNLQSTEVTS